MILLGYSLLLNMYLQKMYLLGKHSTSHLHFRHLNNLHNLQLTPLFEQTPI